MEVNETSQKEKDNMAQTGTLWETNVSPGPREKEISKDSEVNITENCSYLVFLHFQTHGRLLFSPLDVSKAMQLVMTNEMWAGFLGGTAVPKHLTVSLSFWEASMIQKVDLEAWAKYKPPLFQATEIWGLLLQHSLIYTDYTERAWSEG